MCKLGLLARTMRSFCKPRLGEFCLDCALNQDRQEAADPGVGEVLCRALEVVAHGVTRMRETERKYEAIEGLDLLDPAGLLGFDPGTGPHEQNLEAVYFDTADLRLIRAGITLRRREGGSDAGWHLKLPAGKDSREELRLPLGRSARRPPTELVALIRVYTRGAALAPVAELNTRRRRWVLADAHGQALAELVDDHVTARSMVYRPRPCPGARWKSSSPSPLSSSC